MESHREIIISRIADKLAAKAIWLENRGRVFPLLEASAKRLLIKRLDEGDSLNELDDPSNIDLDVIAEWLSLSVKNNADWLHVTHNGIPKYLTDIETYDNLVSVAKFTVGGYDPRLLGTGIIRSQDRIIANLADNFHLVELIAETSIQNEVEKFDYQLKGQVNNADYKHHIFSLRDAVNQSIGLIEAVELLAPIGPSGLWFVDAKEMGAQPMSRKHWELVLNHYSQIKEFKFPQYASEKFPFIIDNYGEFHHVDNLPNQMEVSDFRIEYGHHEGKDSTNRLKIRLPDNLTNTHQLTLRGVDADKLPDTNSNCVCISINNSHIDDAANGLKQTKMDRKIVGTCIWLADVSFGRAPSEMVADNIKIWDCTNAIANSTDALSLTLNVPLPSRPVKMNLDEFDYTIGSEKEVNSNVKHDIKVRKMVATVGDANRLPRGISCDELYLQDAMKESDTHSDMDRFEYTKLVFGDDIKVAHLLSIPVNPSTDISKLHVTGCLKVKDTMTCKTVSLRTFKLKMWWRKVIGYTEVQQCNRP